MLIGYILFFIIVDQITKYLAIVRLRPIGTYNVISNLFSLTYVENTGAAFGMLGGRGVLFLVISTVTILLMLWFIQKRRFKFDLVNVLVASIVIGAIGNWIDRVRFGYVVDFFYVHFFPAVFNVADIFITCGAILLSVYLIFGGVLEIDGKVIS